jgi:hypothetical protein
MLSVSEGWEMKSFPAALVMLFFLGGGYDVLQLVPVHYAGPHQII